ncbi:TPA: helix-turn-helix transcriptional regulator [Clostridium botulinum]|nr:helix-turn-helix transcriptional regulator [Clostridium botulinum]HDK7210988.1 helix-turn-helix transcriptional regulator [Clostridium botulinum]HDK7264153.1 helix-turn-helix transcriptional regulator [Clostridium botulinum]HDK7266182.1 helix-turn-helix transcriptional regulator [Clostridium botulinum]HDK7268175.1 helix-turn-helix transcriptional regulator [Clostridium botulinum]
MVTEKTINEISYGSCYFNPSNFCAALKKQYSITPQKTGRFFRDDFDMWSDWSPEQLEDLIHDLPIGEAGSKAVQPPLSRLEIHIPRYYVDIAIIPAAAIAITVFEFMM